MQRRLSDEGRESIEDDFDWDKVDVDAVLEEAASSQERKLENGNGRRRMEGRFKEVAAVVKDEFENDVRPVIKQELGGKRKREAEEEEEKPVVEPRTPKKVQWEPTNDDQVGGKVFSVVEHQLTKHYRVEESIHCKANPPSHTHNSPSSSIHHHHHHHHHQHRSSNLSRTVTRRFTSSETRTKVESC
jgi:hypothetical protein